MPAIHSNETVLRTEAVAQGVQKITVSWGARRTPPKAGQFFMLRCWGAQDAPLLSRPISLHSYDARTATLQFLVAVRGSGTAQLAALQKGDTLAITGPNGNGFALCPPQNRIALVGGGIGVAPLHQLAKQLVQSGAKPSVFLGFRDAVYATEPLAALGLSVQITTQDGTHGTKGFVTDIFAPQQYQTVYCCGPTAMMQAVAKACAAHGTQCFVSLETKMACGIGACLGCTCHTTSGAKTTCQHGPVFDAKEVFA